MKPPSRPVRFIAIIATAAALLVGCVDEDAKRPPSDPVAGMSPKIHSSQDTILVSVVETRAGSQINSATITTRGLIRERSGESPAAERIASIEGPEYERIYQALDAMDYLERAGDWTPGSALDTFQVIYKDESIKYINGQIPPDVRAIIEAVYAARKPVGP